MCEASRWSSAASYLAQADEILKNLEVTSNDTLRTHANILIQLAKVSQISGSLNRALNYCSRAMSLIVGVDDVIADEIRSLQAALRS